MLKKRNKLGLSCAKLKFSFLGEDKYKFIKKIDQEIKRLKHAKLEYVDGHRR